MSKAMRLLKTIVIIFIGIQSSYAKVKYSVSELIAITKKNNLVTKISGWDVYKSKQQISVEIGNLLPRLNLQTVIGLAEESFISVAASQLGFLYPSNWYKWAQAKDLYNAQKSNFEVNVADQLIATHTLVLSIHSYKELYKEYKRYSSLLNEFYKKAEVALNNNIILPTDMLELKNFKADFDEDMINLEEFLSRALPKLAAQVGLEDDKWDSLDLVDISLPDLTGHKNISYDDYERTILRESRALVAIRHLMNAARNGVGDRTWAFFHPETSGEGSLGYGYTNYVSIGVAGLRKLSDERDLKSNKLKIALRDTVANANYALKRFVVHKGKFQVKQESMSLLDLSFAQGNLNFKQYLPQKIKVLNEILEAKSKLLLDQHQYLIGLAQLERLMWGKHYRGLQDLSPEEISEDHQWWIDFILDQQEDEGYEIEEFRIGSTTFEDGYLKLDYDYFYPGASGPNLNKGEWKIRKDGKILFTFEFKGTEYKAIGKVVRTDYLFSDTVNFDLTIYTISGKRVGTLKLTD